MTGLMKRAAVVLLAIVMALSLSIPVFSFADEGSQSAASPASAAAPSGDSGNAGDADGSSTAAATPADDCTVTLEYYENVIYEEPGIPPNAEGRYLLGTRVLTGLQEGTELDTWDFVVDIPGYFFFDAWPGHLTVSTDPDSNVIKLFYFRYSNYSYTVNYYLMTGADLTADTWSEALAPEAVAFYKLGSEVVEDQPYGKLVEGDAYEYKLDDTYVVDTYPAQIRVGVTPDNDTLNVLYVPSSTNLPDEFEIPDGIIDTGTADTPNAKPPTLPDDETFDKDGITAVLPDREPASGDTGGDGAASGSTGSGNGAADGSSGSDTVAVPGAGTMTKEQIDELFRDFLGAQTDEGVMEITDDMLENPVDPAIAKRIADAYTTGYENGSAAAKAQCAPSLADHIICIIIMIILAILAIVGFALYARDHRKLKQLQEQIPTPEPPIDPLE